VSLYGLWRQYCSRSGKRACAAAKVEATSIPPIMTITRNMGVTDFRDGAPLVGPARGTQHAKRKAPHREIVGGLKSGALLHDDANLADVVHPAQSANDLLGRVNI